MPSCNGASGYTSATLAAPPSTSAVTAPISSTESSTSGSMPAVISRAPAGIRFGGTATWPAPAPAAASPAGVGAANNARTATGTPRSRSRSARHTASVVRHRQRRLVQLAVHRHRQRRQHHHRRRHHVIRQPPRRVPAHQPGQPFGTSTAAVPAVPVTGWDHIADQPLITRGVLADRHHRLRHPRMRRQHRLHLTRLHPEPPDLHLIINTPAEHQLPIRGPPHHIPGPVHPLPTTTKRARHKPLRRQTRPPPLPPPPPHPRHIQLPRHPHRHRAQPPIQHKHPHIRQRRPDHTAATTRRTPRVHHPIRHIHRCRGRPLHVDQHRPPATPCLPTHQPPRIQRLPRQTHPPQRQPPPRPPIPSIGLRWV